MPRLISISLVFVLLLVGVAPSWAGDHKPRELERMSKKLERLFQPLEGRMDVRKIAFKRHGDGIFSLSYPLAQTKSPAGVAALGTDKQVLTLNIGHMASEPTNPGNVITAVVADAETKYNLWWAVVNQGGEEATRKTSVTMAGPEGFELEVVDDVIYPANAVSLFWFNPDVAFEAVGVYTYRIAVKTGGKMYYRFWVEPLSSD
jgi:hypothetical protein